MDRTPHTVDNRLIVFLLHHRVVALIEAAVERVAPLDMLHYVGDIVVAPIGNRCRQIGHLEWRAAELTLTDSHRNHRQRVPPRVVVIVELRRGDKTASFGGKVGAEFLAEAEATHILGPIVISSLHNTSSGGIVEYVAEYVAEIGVAGVGRGLLEVEWRAVLVALHTSADVVALFTGVAAVGGNHTLL